MRHEEASIAIGGDVSRRRAALHELHGDHPGDVKVSDQSYVHHDGLTDPTILNCSDESSDPSPDGAPPAGDGTPEGSGERQQNEPTVAVNPISPQYMTAGANDYCTVQTIGDAWAGFYYSSDGGATWTNSLVPGYPTDTSTAGQASPLYRFVLGAGDPVQAWDRANHLYYAGIAFNRVRPVNGSIWLARYHWPSGAAPTYEFTRLVSRGTPTPFGIGHFEDKIEVEADKRAESPFQGNVYLCWARFTGAGNNFVEFARSSDGGRTFSIQKISEGIHGNQSCDIGISRTGAVFVAWRQFDFTPGQDVPQKQRDAVAWVKSTNGGRSFTKPAVAFEFIHWDMTDRSPSGARRRDCGDGPQACQSGYAFGRADSGPRITADPVSGEGDEAYIVVEASVPGSQTATGSTYGTIDPGTGSQGSIYFSKTVNGGATWSTPSRVDPQTTGHQFYSDIDIDNGLLYVVYQDSRNDNASGPPGTVGDYRTVPFGNLWVGGAAKAIAGRGLETWYSWSTDGGGTWSHAKASDVAYLQNYEQFGNRDVPFFGDYNYVDVAGTTVAMV
ncbi:MAG TPA: hypothetical protein VFJ45_05260 [bacterium]|nr:hypothetical protein [bacterium]